MFEEIYEPLPDVDAYLERIGYDGPRECTVEVLDKLLECQQMSVPFEDLSVYTEGKVPSLAVRDLFDKIVTRHRGGYCFEVNGGFYALLKAMGFDCWSVTCRIHEGKPYPQLPNHRATLVAFDDDCRFCDCGSGNLQPGRSLTVVDDGVQHTDTGDFRIVREGGHFNLVAIVKKTGEEYLKLSFTSAPTELVDFNVMNFFCAGDPESPFRNMRLVNMRTPTGSVAIEGNMLREHVNGELTETELDDEGIVRALKERFGIEL